MIFVDVHNHIDHEQFNADRDQVITRAKKAGCTAIIANSTNEQSTKRILDIQKEFPIVKLAVGLYPEYAEQSLDFVREYAKHAVAIGEIGLDGTVSTKFELQQAVFSAQLNIASEMKLPVIIHSRKAETQVLEQLKDHQFPVILHCFCASHRLIKLGIERNYFFSIPPKVVYDMQFQQLVSLVPIQLLLTETDSPYLGVEKGVRNEPANCTATIEKIAQIKQLDPQETANMIFANYQRAFSRIR